MSLLTTRTVSLSIALLLAGTSLSHAGFVWLSPDNKSEGTGTVYGQQAEPAAPAESVQGRAWSVDPSVPVASAPAPVVSQATVPMLAPAAEPVVIAPAAPVVPLQTGEAAPIVLTSGDTMAAQPIYAPGDQKPELAASVPAPVVPAPVVEAPAQIAVAPVVPAAEPAEVTLASSRDLMKPTPVSQPGDSAAVAMPSAEAMISSMPSMTAPRGEAAPAAPTPAPVVTAPAPAAPAGSAVSLVTGQSVSTPQQVAAPAADVTSKPVNGFGKHVPLVIAMRQILPEGYGFAHGNGVDLTTSVDWQGGRPWPQVLAEAISPLGLTASVMGDTVMLEKLPSVPAVAVAPAVTAPAAPVAPGQAVLTNATVMQTPPSNN